MSLLAKVKKLEEENKILRERCEKSEKAEQELEQIKLKYPQLFSQQQTNPQNPTTTKEAAQSGNTASSLLYEDQLPEIARIDTQPEKRKNT